MKTTKKKPARQGTRRVINAQAVTPYGLLTYRGGETAFFLLRPTCISVLPEDALAARVGALVTLFKSQPELEILCLNSRESFANNTRYLEARIGEEENPYIADLLEKDKAHLGSVQLQTATAREFVLAVRLEDVREKEKYPYLARVEKLIRDQGFDVRRADLDDVKRLMAVYFVQDFTSEHYDDFDGQRWVEWTGVQADRKAPDSASQEAAVKEFLDLAAPSVLRFETDRFICGNTYRCVWAVRGYPASTTEQALLHRLGEKAGVSVHIYTRRVTPAEEKKILQNADKANRLKAGNTGNVQDVVEAESNLQDVVTLVSAMHRNREPLLHCAVYLELTAQSYDQLKLLQTEVLTELVRSKLNVDRLMLRQQQGFVSVMPSGHNAFGSQFERVLPASSVANLYPFNYSGKTDPQGFYIGKDKYGANVIVDFDKRDDDKTSANILILGNSGQGKSYLMKLLLLNLLEAGKSAISLDVEHEQKDMCEAVGGCFLDLMSGQYRINPLEPKCWDAGGSPEDMDAPAAFRQSTRLSQHISFLRDFFRSYKSFTDRQIDVIEIMVGRLYERWRISDSTDFSRLTPEDYPILSDLYALIEQEYRNFDEGKYQLYTAAILQEILLGLHSMCKGAESKFFNGHTNVTSSRFVVFGVKGLLQASKNVRSAMLFNVLSYLSDKLLTEGNTVAALDELYIWLSDNVAVGTTIIEYIRNCLKRVRKKESAMLLASQNLEDFNQEGIRELTKPLFAIPPHQFLFNAGAVDKKFYMEALQLEESEYNLIRFPQRGVCLYRCGNERYLLEVHAPAYKEALFGKAGGR